MMKIDQKVGPATTLANRWLAFRVRCVVLACFLFLASAGQAVAQVFSDVTSAAGLSGITNTYGLDWGDYNNDGYPDFYITGSGKLYKNNGNGTFSPGPSMPVLDRAVHWGDYDNDGYLDIGTTWNLSLSRNNGNGTFTLQYNPSVGITSINNLGNFAWLDYNQDGYLDLWAPNGSSPYAYMYAGNGGSFTAIDGDTIGLVANENGENTIVGDYDNDGWMDILLLSNRISSGVWLFHNNGDGTFTDVAAAAGVTLPKGSGNGGPYNGSAFGDYDNDGDLDLYGGQGGSNKLYRNNGNGTFTDVTSAAGVAGTSSVTKGVTWGDYDNDGDLDLYVAQNDATNQLFRNNGNGTFTDVASAQGVADASSSGGAMWEDYDLDGDLDLLVGNSSGQSKLFRNGTNDTNYLRVRVLGAGACATNAAGIGVRVSLYDAAGTTFIAMREIGTASSFGSSKPKWAHFGGLNPAASYTVKVGFVTGTVSVSVVPASVSTLIGSTTIAQMLTVQETVTNPNFVNVSNSLGFNFQTVSTTRSPGSIPGSGLYWGDLDGDGDLDAIATGNSSARLVINNNAGQSFSVSTLGTGSLERQGALLDVDNDGDLDFWHINEKLFENDGSATFTDKGALGFTQPSNNEGVVAADVNGDGWCDVVMFSENGNWIGNNQGASPAALVGTNNSSDGLHVSGAYGNGDFCSSGDANNDGFLDFWYNYGPWGGLGGKLFLSNGDGTYTWNNMGISVVTGNSDKMGTAWGDYDNDGDLDFFASRFDSGQQGYLWQNRLKEDGAVAFVDVTTTAGITDTSNQQGCCWGDYDNDGDLDLYIVTDVAAANLLYQNQGDGTFLLACAGAEAVGDGLDGVFVDYDNDGDLDIAITQRNAPAVLLRNNTDNNNYLKVRVIGCGAPKTNKAAVGIRVELWDATCTTRLARREIGVARGFAGAEPMWVHFGGVTNTSTYMVKVYFNSRSANDPYKVTVVPANTSTTIGSTTIPQMLTVTEPCTAKIIQWREIRNSAAGS